MTKMIGRVEECQQLQEMLNSKRSEFLAIYGRRRVGKTFLIREFFENVENCIFFNATGMKNGALKLQIQNFTEQIGVAFFKGVMPQPGKNWHETFKILTQSMQNVASDQKIILFIDELPWLASKNSKVLESIDYYWNQHWSRNAKIKLIVCGSSSSWLINKIINNKAGLHNRITRKIQLKPFTLREVKLFIESQGIRLSNKQIVDIYMVAGGIPYYLTGLSKGSSAVQIIEKLAFKHNSILLKEFDNLFSSLFTDADPYIELIRIIAKNRYGVALTDIVKKFVRFPKGGRTSSRLKELKEAGFLLSFKPYQNKKKGVYYRLIDEYTLFYLHWIEPIRDSIQEENLESGYWQGIHHTPTWYAWSGYAFESVCYKHLSAIRKKLEIPVTAFASSWRYIPKEKSSDMGVQIDLLFDRADHAITLCEIKYSDSPFLIDKKYAANLLRKREVFIQKTETISKQVLFCLITANGIKNNFYVEELIDGVVTLDDLFV